MFNLDRMDDSSDDPEVAGDSCRDINRLDHILTRYHTACYH